MTMHTMLHVIVHLRVLCLSYFLLFMDELALKKQKIDFEVTEGYCYEALMWGGLALLEFSESYVLPVSVF